MITRRVTYSSIRDYDRRLKGMRLQPTKYDDFGGVEYTIMRISAKYHTENTKKKRPMKAIAVLNVDPEAVVTKIRFKKQPHFSNEDVYRVLALTIKYDFIVNENTVTTMTTGCGKQSNYELFADKTA